jgi:hypothetical protein
VVIAVLDIVRGRVFTAFRRGAYTEFLSDIEVHEDGRLTVVAAIMSDLS